MGALATASLVFAHPIEAWMTMILGACAIYVWLVLRGAPVFARSLHLGLFGLLALGVVLPEFGLLDRKLGLALPFIILSFALISRARKSLGNIEAARVPVEMQRRLWKMPRAERRDMLANLRAYRKNVKPGPRQ
ncbi:hypothetical protein [Tateyamaria sp. ANG-S1]|uniref:hypothetical protein n=1 Tax=Tateyamaria sp. ANG-S1 TaxID=1577905 RepID=UPI001269AE97|nr:hypothetical protein [Tateyamaria sp. ANG-S1]